MNEIVIAFGMSAWFGILTSISPCPLASNIAAVSYIGGQHQGPRRVLLAGALYTAGRALTYTLLGALLISSTQHVSAVANFLQTWMNILLGPVLILVGLVLFDVIRFGSFGLQGRFGGIIQSRIGKIGVWGAGVLGIVFALSFCPVSAALFFGSLFSVAFRFHSPVAMPALFGIGTALPVVVFAFVIAFASDGINRAFQGVTRFEWWARKGTAVIFIGAGGYYIIRYIFEWI